MKQLRLSNRLASVAALAGECAGVVDVGTDHGLLPVWLAQNGAAGRLVAADIRKGPLRRAMAAAAEYGLDDRIEFYLTDGLDGIGRAGLGAVVIAGMGGETIAHILEKAAWTREGRVRCVLQPQSKTDALTGWLEANGYQVLDAALSEDDGRLYLAFAAGAGERGEFREPLQLLLSNRDPLLPRYLAGLIGKTRRALTGLERSRDRRDGDIDEKRAALKKYRRMKEETDAWQK